MARVCESGWTAWTRCGEAALAVVDIMRPRRPWRTPRLRGRGCSEVWQARRGGPPRGAGQPGRCAPALRPALGVFAAVRCTCPPAHPPAHLLSPCCSPQAAVLPGPPQPHHLLRGLCGRRPPVHRAGGAAGSPQPWGCGPLARGLQGPRGRPPRRRRGPAASPMRADLSMRRPPTRPPARHPSLPLPARSWWEAATSPRSSAAAPPTACTSARGRSGPRCCRWRWACSTCTTAASCTGEHRTRSAPCCCLRVEGGWACSTCTTAA